MLYLSYTHTHSHKLTQPVHKMACATLKRSLDWESINQRPTKRRRCGPFGAAGSSAHHHHHHHQHHSQAAAAGCSRSFISEPVPSVFDNAAAGPTMTPEKMAQNIREEITRLHRSKQLTFSSATVAACRSAATNAGDRMQDSDNSGSEMGGPDSPGRSDSPPSSPSTSALLAAGHHHHQRHIARQSLHHQRRLQHQQLLQHQQQQQSADKELFSFKQVQLICERMLKEREEFLREQYDQVLTTKLAEQYDAFVKFTYDQIQRRYEAAPSYLS